MKISLKNKQLEAIRLANVRRKVADRETTMARKAVMKAYIVAFLAMIISLVIVILN